MRRLFLCCLVFLGGLLIRPEQVLAHNSLAGSTPAQGAVLDQAPSEIVWTFVNPVPLDTLTVTLIDAGGVRTELSGSTHGPSGEEEVVTPLPALSAGEVSVRWRLVGADGHPVSERVTFTIQSPSPTTPPAVVSPTVPVPAAAVSTPPTTTTTAAPVGAVDSDAADPGVWSTPKVVRWLLRGLSYVAIVLAAGVVLTHLFVLRGSDWSATKRWLQPAIVVIGVTALLQLLVIASDIGGRALWRSFSSIDQAVESTDAGAAFMVRIVLTVCAWLLLVHAPPTVVHARNELLVMISLIFLATWSFAGHSSSMRWPALGIPLDIVHHGAAAAWLGGLAVVGLSALPALSPEDARPVMQRFSQLATVAVIAIVVTGLVQAVRLVGGPGQLLEANHGKLLTLKVAGLVVMLVLADLNRRRLTARLSTAGASAAIDVAALRRGMAAELLIGLVIIGITAAMVVSPPATSTVVALTPSPII